MQVAFGLYCGSKARKIEAAEFRIEQFGLNADLHIGREIVCITRGHFGLRGGRWDSMHEAQDFAAQLVQQQARGDVGIVRLLLDQCARGHDRGESEFVLPDPVVKIAACFGEHQRGINAIEPGAGLGDDSLETPDVENDARSIRQRCMQDGFSRSLLRNDRFGTLAGTLFAIQHIGTGHLVMLAAHQREFDLVLHIFDMEGPAFADAAGQRGGDFLRELLDHFMNAARSGGGMALDGEERLGHRDRDFRRIEFGHGAVAADHLHRRFARRGLRKRFKTQLNDRLVFVFGGMQVERHRMAPWCCFAGGGSKAHEHPAKAVCTRPPDTPSVDVFSVSRQVSWLAGRR